MHKSFQDFKRLYTYLMSRVVGTEAERIIECLEDVSTMLAMVSSVGEKHIETVRWLYYFLNF